MNRFKKELRKHGFHLENDFPCMPYQDKHITIECIEADAEKMTLKTFLNVGVEILTFDRSMNVCNQDFL